MSVGYKRDPRPASTTPTQTTAIRTSTLLAATERIRQQEDDIRTLNARIRAVGLARQTLSRPQTRSPSPTGPPSHSHGRRQQQGEGTSSPSPLLNILLVGLAIMLTERMEDGDASVGRVFRILDDILVLLLDPVFEDVFVAGSGVQRDDGISSGSGNGSRGSRGRGGGGWVRVGNLPDGYVLPGDGGTALAGASEAA